MKRPLLKLALLLFLVLLLVSGGLFFFVVPGQVMASKNYLTQATGKNLSPAAAALHAGLVVVDLHADALLWNRDLLLRDTRGHVDIPRLIEGNIALQGFSATTKVPVGINIESNPSDSDMLPALMVAQRWPVATWTSPFQRALYQAELLASIARRSEGRFTLVRTREDLAQYLQRRKSDPACTAGFLTIEGLHCLEGKIENLQLLFDAGYRQMAPTHFFDTELGGSAHGRNKMGITEFGKAVLEEMARLHILLDLAHASPQLIEDSLALAKGPVVVSHTGVQGTCNNRRNLSDAQLKAVAATGGVVGIGFWDTATCGDDVASIVRSLQYATAVAGVDHVALGSDWDGSTATPVDASGIGQITQGLLDAGMAEEDISKIMGQNTVRVLLESLPMGGKGAGA